MFTETGLPKEMKDRGANHKVKQKYSWLKGNLFRLIKI